MRYEMIYEMISYIQKLGRVRNINMYQRNVYKCGVVSPRKGSVRFTKGQVSPEASSIDVCFNGGSLRPIEKH